MQVCLWNEVFSKQALPGINRTLLGLCMVPWLQSAQLMGYKWSMLRSFWPAPFAPSSLQIRHEAAAMPIAPFIRASPLCPLLRRCGLSKVIGVSFCWPCSLSQEKKRKGWMCPLCSYAISKQQSFRVSHLDKREIRILLPKKILQESNTASAVPRNYSLLVPASSNAAATL